MNYLTYSLSITISAWKPRHLSLPQSADEGHELEEPPLAAYVPVPALQPDGSFAPPVATLKVIERL